MADQIHFKSRSKNGLAVYKRVSGMHDKVVYYELYDDDVKFDLSAKVPVRFHEDFTQSTSTNLGTNCSMFGLSFGYCIKIKHMQVTQYA